MTYVLVLSAKMRRHEQLKRVVMTYYRHWQYVWANFWPKKIHCNFNLRSKFTNFLLQSSDFYHEGNMIKIKNILLTYLLTCEKDAMRYTSPDLAHNLFSDRLWAPLLYLNFTLLQLK